MTPQLGRKEMEIITYLHSHFRPYSSIATSNRKVETRHKGQNQADEAARRRHGLVLRVGDCGDRTDYEHAYCC